MSSMTQPKVLDRDPSIWRLTSTHKMMEVSLTTKCSSNLVTQNLPTMQWELVYQQDTCSQKTISKGCLDELKEAIAMQQNAHPKWAAIYLPAQTKSVSKTLWYDLRVQNIRLIV